MHCDRREILLLFIFQRTVAGRGAVVFEQDVVTHGVDEGAEPVRLTKLSAAQSDENPGKGFLAYVFNRLRRMQPGAKLELDQLTEVRHEMFLRAKVSRTESFDIGFVKRLELQGLAPRVAEVAASLALQVEEDGTCKPRCNESGGRGTIAEEVDENQPFNSRSFRVA